jgi:hypothetical protein
MLLKKKFNAQVKYKWSQNGLKQCEASHRIKALDLSASFI